jgi:hypothetical protein
MLLIAYKQFSDKVGTETKTNLIMRKQQLTHGVGLNWPDLHTFARRDQLKSYKTEKRNLKLAIRIKG